MQHLAFSDYVNAHINILRLCPIKDLTALKRVQDLYVVLGITGAEGELKRILEVFIQTYSPDRTKLSGVFLLKQLMHDYGLKQKDLVHIFGHKSIISEVLRGRRTLSNRHKEGLAILFNIPAHRFTYVPSNVEGE